MNMIMFFLGVLCFEWVNEMIIIYLLIFFFLHRRAPCRQFAFNYCVPHLLSSTFLVTWNLVWSKVYIINIHFFLFDLICWLICDEDSYMICFLKVNCNSPNAIFMSWFIWLSYLTTWRIDKFYHNLKILYCFLKRLRNLTCLRER